MAGALISVCSRSSAPNTECGAPPAYTADGNGNYSVTVSWGWYVTITPSKLGYTFTPASFSNTTPLTSDMTVNFTAVAATPIPVPTVSISGNVGIAGAQLFAQVCSNGTCSLDAYTTADASGNYSVTVPYGWSGTVTPDLAGVTFAPASRSYTNVTADQTLQNYAAAFTSSAGRDGWVLESGENTTVGGTMNSDNTTFQLGDDSSNRQYRAILSFNTSALPDTATITSAVLKVKQNGLAVGTNPFTTLGGLKVDIHQGSFNNAALELTDFDADASALAVSTFNSTPVSNWYSATFSSGLNYINRAGLTQLRLRFATDDNNNHLADYMNFLSGDAASGMPQLIITYTLP